MDFRMHNALMSYDELFVLVILQYWNQEQPLDEWVDAELVREDFDEKYGETRFLMREALQAQVALRARLAE